MGLKINLSFELITTSVKKADLVFLVSSSRVRNLENIRQAITFALLANKLIFYADGQPLDVKSLVESLPQPNDVQGLTNAVDLANYCQEAADQMDVPLEHFLSLGYILLDLATEEKLFVEKDGELVEVVLS